MTDRKKYMITGVIIIFAILLGGIGFVVASGPAGFCDGTFHSKFHGKGRHAWSHKGNFSDHVLTHLDERVEKLKLTETQDQRYKEIREKIKSRLEDKVVDREMFFEDLRKEIQNDSPNAAKIASLVKSRIDIGSSFIKEHLDYAVELYEILNEDQRNQLMECIRERLDRHA